MTGVGVAWVLSRWSSTSGAVKRDLCQSTLPVARSSPKTAPSWLPSPLPAGLSIAVVTKTRPRAITAEETPSPGIGVLQRMFALPSTTSSAGRPRPERPSRRGRGTATTRASHRRTPGQATTTPPPRRAGSSWKAPPVLDSHGTSSASCRSVGPSPPSSENDHSNRCSSLWRSELLPQNFLHRLSFCKLIDQLV